MRRISCLAFFVCVTAFTMIACGQSPTAGDGSTSKLNYISFSESAVRQSLVARATINVINVCLQGQMTAADLERVKTWAARAILTWYRAVKVLDERVTNQVAFTCQNKHMTFNLRQGNGTSFAGPSVATIYLSRPYGTWTHELGHALAGLSDTYSSGAGSCKSGQPQSLMCWGAYGPRRDPEQWSTLWPDDIAGIQANYRKVFGNQLTPPDWANEQNLEAPLDLAKPWPEEATHFVAMDEQLEVEIVHGPATEIDDSPNTSSIDL